MNELVEEEIEVEDLIYEIRDKQVMLDSDLAKLYGCKNGTKEINQAVKNNLQKFPERFSWILADEDYKNLRSKILTTDLKSHNYWGRRYNTRVFTEQGVAMLATILKSNIAAMVSIRIMDAFVAMKQYISTDLVEQRFIRNQVMKNTEDIKALQESFKRFDVKKENTEVYYAGQMYDAYSKILDIFNEAKKELIILDNYADKMLLDIIKKLKTNVIIVTKSNNLLTENDISRYNLQYNNLNVVYNETFHDRYFIIDKKTVYHCGTSINRIGYKTFSITLISDNDVSKSIINSINIIIKKKV